MEILSKIAKLKIFEGPVGVGGYLQNFVGHLRRSSFVAPNRTQPNDTERIFRRRSFLGGLRFLPFSRTERTKRFQAFPRSGDRTKPDKTGRFSDEQTEVPLPQALTSVRSARCPKRFLPPALAKPSFSGKFVHFPAG
jgi:hypothetical protein